jgi:hypothetical protein
MEYASLSTEQITYMFQKADQELKQALLDGKEWKEISDKRYRYTELSIELHKRKKPEDFGYSPADTALRKH